MRYSKHELRATSDKRRIKSGVTLIEMLVVVGVIVLLVSMIISLAARIDNQSKENLTKNTIVLLSAALEQFQDFGYNYKVSATALDAERNFYRSLDFPLDCNEFPKPALETELGNALDVIVNIDDNAGSHEDMYSGCEALYFFLSRLPQCRKTLDQIDKSLITSQDKNKNDMTIEVDSRKFLLLRIIDPWGQTLRYDYYDEKEMDFDDRAETKRNFPLITSAGPDKTFETDDDIISRQ